MAMLDQFYSDYADTQRTPLMQYCKQENVLPASLVYKSKSKSTMKLRLERMAFHMLQRMNRGLNIMMSRLTDDMKHGGIAQRYLS